MLRQLSFVCLYTFRGQHFMWIGVNKGKWHVVGLQATKHRGCLVLLVEKTCKAGLGPATAKDNNPILLIARSLQGQEGVKRQRH